MLLRYHKRMVSHCSTVSSINLYADDLLPRFPFAQHLIYTCLEAIRRWEALIFWIYEFLLVDIGRSTEDVERCTQICDRQSFGPRLTNPMSVVLHAAL